VINIAVRLVCSARGSKFDHITPLLLTFIGYGTVAIQRIEFKLFVLFGVFAFRCLPGIKADSVADLEFGNGGSFGSLWMKVPDWGPGAKPR